MAKFSVVSPPVEEPVSLDEMRGHLRVSDTAEDPLIETYIAAARGRIEARTRLRLVTQTVTLVLEAFEDVIMLPIGPVQSVEEVRYSDAAGVARVLASSEYRLATDRVPPRLVPAAGKTWPATDTDPVEIDLVVGYGGATDVPADLRVAVMMQAAHLFQNREAVAAQGMADVPLGVAALIEGHILWL